MTHDDTVTRFYTVLVSGKSWFEPQHFEPSPGLAAQSRDGLPMVHVIEDQPCLLGVFDQAAPFTSKGTMETGGVHSTFIGP